MALTAYIDETGIHIPNYPEVLEDLKNDFRGIYGQDLYLEADSQEGELCAVFALRIYDCYALAQSIYSAYSPHTAQGVGLSSVVKTNGIRRHSASRSSADLRLVGQAGTTINNGVAKDEAGQRWMLPEHVVIPLSGEITVTAQAEHEGALRAAPGEIRYIATPTRGWQSVENPEPARPGAAVETDFKLRRRQSLSTALPSLSILDGAKGAVASLTNVIRSRGYENDTPETDAHGIPPHSISFVVEGGDAAAIGAAIAVKKGPGCGTYGDMEVETRDSYGEPNIIRFFRPSIVNIAVNIRIQPLSGYVSATGENIRRNIAEYVSALDIGEDILLSKLYTPINAAEPAEGVRTFDVLELSIGQKDGDILPQNLAIAFNAAASCNSEDVTLTDYQP